MEAQYHIFNEDCIGGLAARVPDNSIDLTITSIPFEELFTYSGKLEDVGNNGSTVDIRAGRFALNMRFVIDQLLRVTKPGCNLCIHIQQLLAYKVQHGFMGRRDFRGAIIDLFTKGGQIGAHEVDENGIATPFVIPSLRGGEGFNCIGEAVLPKCPQQMAQRLNLHSLQFKTGYARSSTNLAPAVNDYVLIFQKPGTIERPVRCIWQDSNPTGWISTDDWVRWARGIWDDVLQIDVLDGASLAKEHDNEKHVCPLQLELIRRCVLMYSNPISIQSDVTVLDPFIGIGSTAWVCLGGPTIKGDVVNEPRSVLGFELKESYHRQSLANAGRATEMWASGTAAPSPQFEFMKAGA
jgi:DNA modification methylase